MSGLGWRRWGRGYDTSSQTSVSLGNLMRSRRPHITVGPIYQIRKTWVWGLVIGHPEMVSSRWHDYNVSESERQVMGALIKLQTKPSDDLICLDPVFRIGVITSPPIFRFSYNTPSPVSNILLFPSPCYTDCNTPPKPKLMWIWPKIQFFVCSKPKIWKIFACEGSLPKRWSSSGGPLSGGFEGWISEKVRLESITTTKRFPELHQNYMYFRITDQLSLHTADRRRLFSTLGVPESGRVPTTDEF